MSNYQLYDLPPFIKQVDDYYLERPSHIPEEVYDRSTKFDTPTILDLNLLTTHLHALNAGETTTKPIYQCTTFSRCSTEVLTPTEVVLIEGIFA